MERSGAVSENVINVRTGLKVSGLNMDHNETVLAVRLGREAVNAVLELARHRRSTRGLTWPAGLTEREVDVLRRVAQAKPNKAIAKELVISDETVRNHVRHIYEKIGVSNRAGAVLFAMENDLIRQQRSGTAGLPRQRPKDDTNVSCAAIRLPLPWALSRHFENRRYEDGTQ